jgi:hypothetical protein
MIERSDSDSSSSEQIVVPKTSRSVIKREIADKREQRRKTKVVVAPETDSDSSEDLSLVVAPPISKKRSSKRKAKVVELVETDSDSSEEPVRVTKKRSSKRKAEAVIESDSDSDVSEEPFKVPKALIRRGPDGLPAPHPEGLTKSELTARSKELFRNIKYERLPIILDRPVDAWDIFVARHDGKYIETKKSVHVTKDSSDAGKGERIEFNLCPGYTHERLAADMDLIQEELSSGKLDGAIKQMYDLAFSIMEEMAASSDSE